jgi:hypothetical protein
MFEILIVLVVVGVLLWLVNTYIPMDAKIKKIINIVAVVIVILWLCNVFGIFDYLKRVPAPHVEIPSVKMIG